MTTETAAAPATPHPAKFSPQILKTIYDALTTYMPEGGNVLDPFAGVGGVHELGPDYDTYAVELEREWYLQSRARGFSWLGDWLQFEPPETFWTGPSPSALNDRSLFEVDAIVTSPTYGNRMADSHTPSPEDTSRRITYTHKLGRALSDNNSGAMQWGDQYKAFHRLAWRKAYQVVRPGGLFVLNVKDHARKGEFQGVPEWHKDVLLNGLRRWLFVDEYRVPVKGMGYGENQQEAVAKSGAKKADHEMVYVFRKPT